MFVRFRFLLLPSLLPLALAACVDSGPAIAIAPATPPLGVDLGGAPARRAGAVELAAAKPVSMTDDEPCRAWSRAGRSSDGA